MDVSGPHVDGRGFGQPVPRGGCHKYFLMAVFQPPPADDGKAKKAWPYIRWLRSKQGQEVLRAVQSVIAAVNAAHAGKAVWRVHTDRGGEFVNIGLKSWLASQAVEYTTTEGHDPAANGAAESMIGKIKSRARALLAVASLDTGLWTFAAMHATWCSRQQAQERPAIDTPIFGKKIWVREGARERRLQATSFNCSIPGLC